MEICFYLCYVQYDTHKNTNENCVFQYPAWLEENKSKLSEEDLKRYTAQLEVVQKIVAELEKEEGEGDKEHLDRMIELMGKVSLSHFPPPHPD